MHTLSTVEAILRCFSFLGKGDQGTRTAAGKFAPDGRLLLLHRLTGAHELPQAGSPYPGGEFFAEPQRGDSPSADGGSVAAPAAGTAPYPRRRAKRKGHLRFPFLFELLPFPCFLIWRRPETGDRFEKRNGSRVTVAWLSPLFRSSQIAYCYTGELLYAGATQGELPEGQERVPWGMPVSRNSLVWRLQTAPTKINCI